MAAPAPHPGAGGKDQARGVPRPRRTVHLDSAAVGVIRRHARESAPADCCGALIGLVAGEQPAGEPAEGAQAGSVRIARVLPARNVAPDDRHYIMAPEDVLRAEAEAVEVGLEVVGFYHSHPVSAPEPSATDVETAWPWYTYLIVGASTGELRAWRLVEDRTGVEEEALRTEAGP